MTKVLMRGVVSLSFTPGFSRVFDGVLVGLVGNRFNGFPARTKTAETVSNFGRPRFAGLKPVLMR